jgi:hypothetical protein
MFTIKKIILLAAIALVLCTCAVMADTGCPQVPETQGFVTSTAMSALGTVTETDNIVNIIASWTGSAPVPYPLGGLQLISEYTGTYSEDTIADQGLVTYTKAMTTDTSGMATTGLYNVETSKVLEFIGSDTGRMTSEEQTVIDGAGTPIWDMIIMTCPFASNGMSYNPSFCNIVQEGSSVDLTLGSLATDTQQRYIMKAQSNAAVYSPDMPLSDPGVESGYSVKLTGFGDVPAMGSAEAFINVHIQEERAFVQEIEALGQGELSNPKAEDVVYSETTTASGDITIFQKVMSYNSKITEPGPMSVPG